MSTPIIDEGEGIRRSDILCRRAAAGYLSCVAISGDEEVFDEPLRIDVGRDPNKHLAFGYRMHCCLDAALAGFKVESIEPEGNRI